MADNVRFHNKYHRRNHHSEPSPGYPDSGSDPIASQSEPFVGGFYARGPLSATGNLTIGGNALVYGNLSALGDFSVIDTFVTVTSALSVVNKNTGPAFTVVQTGTQDIAVFLDDTQNALKIMDGAKIRFFEQGSSGAIGINTTDLANALTVRGTVSASGNLTINGNTTLGDTSADVLTINGTNVSVPNNLNIDTNTLYIDSANDKVGIGTTIVPEKLTVVGNISATGNLIIGGNAFLGDTSDSTTVNRNLSVVGSTNTFNLSTRFIDLIHIPANDGTNPFLRIGEIEPTSTSLSAFTGFKLEYDEITNSLNLSSLGFDTQKQIVQFNKSGLVTLNDGLCAVGNSYMQFLSSRDITIVHSPANDGINPTFSIGEYTFNSTTLSAFSGYEVEYDETSNDLNLSALGFSTSRQALKITPAGNIRTNLLSAISPKYFTLNNLVTNLTAVTGLGQDDLSHFIGGRVGINTTPVSSYAMHIRGGNLRVDGIDYSSVPGFNGSIYDSDGQSLLDLRSASENANYSVSIASSGLNNFFKFFGGRSGDQNPFIAVRKGQPVRFAQLNNYYGTGFAEIARIGGNSNVSIGLSAEGAERLTVLGNISASGNVYFYSATGRNLDLIHTPANDGIDPTLRIGELTPTSTTLSAFSGFHFEYDENTNTLILSSAGFAKAKTVATFDSNNKANFNSVSYPLTAIDYSTAGTFTYTLPDLTNYSWVKIIAVGGGGGGGSGRREPANGINPRYGGGGGAGGDYCEVTYPISYISANTTARVIVGAAGTGGSAIASPLTANGNNGTTGGTSAVIFNTNGVTVSALGGPFGYGGSSVTGTGGQPPGIGGKGGESSVSRTAREGSGTSIGGGGAGGGGGVTSGGGTDYDGGPALPGGTIGGTSVQVNGGAGGGTAGASAVAPTQIANALFVVCGTGGGGGAGARNGSSGGAGGNGATPGGGGGGGGGVGNLSEASTSTSGAGGNGGAGLVRIIFY